MVLAPEPEPYYQHEGITIYNADCRDVLPTLDPKSIGLLLTDPPYGINLITKGAHRGQPKQGDKPCKSNARTEARDYPPVYGDDAPFDPAHLLAFGTERLVLFGANYYASKLPERKGWLVWDKLAGMMTDKQEIGVNMSSDVELAWTNLDIVARLIPVRWLGVFNDEYPNPRRHPTQKPIKLMQSIIGYFARIGGTILDPYMGAGSTLIGARRAGWSAIGMEIVKDYCDIAIERLEKEGRA